jgi:hypothetical protein
MEVVLVKKRIFISKRELREIRCHDTFKRI